MVSRIKINAHALKARWPGLLKAIELVLLIALVVGANIALLRFIDVSLDAYAREEPQSGRAFTKTAP